MKIGLIDVDGHHFPNLALMRISAYHKACGDTVEWWWSDFEHYDIVYMSKVFSATYSKDVPEPLNADRVIKGGTGYAIHTIDGKEVYDTHAHTLPPEIEAMPPDYTIYPQFDFAVSMTSRGCPRGCPFCHVGAKEGRKSVMVSPVSRFWSGQDKIVVLDPNITACPDKRDLFDQYVRTGAWINFSQGLDIRLLDDADVDDINRMKIKQLHFAWDNPKEDLRDRFEWFAGKWKKQNDRDKVVYCLTNYNSTIEQDLYRIYTLRDLGYDPYVMVYDKLNAPKEIRRLQRWCNAKTIFHSTKRFEEYGGNT